MGNSKKTWHITGLCFDGHNPDAPKEGSIVIPEEDGDIIMDPEPSKVDPQTPKDSDPFGMPIDADLAVHLIQNLLPDALNFSNGGGNHSNELSEEMEINKVLFTENVIKLTYGVTFDKSIVLKILSQPSCEGLRCYLCSRKEERKGDHYSLVLVGVNRHGYDLNFDKPDTISKNSVKTQSLVAEYGYPPNGKTLIDIADDPHYVLLNLANTRPKHV